MDMTIRNMVTEYLKFCQFRKELDEKTLKAYRIDLRQFFDFCDSADPSREKIEEYVTELHRQYKHKTVKRKIASIKAFYHYLEEEEIIEDTPFRKIRVNFKESFILPRIIPRVEIEQLLNCMYAQYERLDGLARKLWLRDMAVVEMFFATGARVSEISNIQKNNIDLTSGLLCIEGKGDKERYVQIGDEDVLTLLREYYSENAEDIEKCGSFFVNIRGKRFTEQSIRGMLKRHAKQAGIERKLTPHMFRHSLATYLIEEGVDISFVQQILGHSSIRTTQIYIHVAAGKQAEILKEKHPRKNMRIQSTF